MQISRLFRNELHFLLLFFSLISAFYQPPNDLTDITLEIPESIEELRRALCNNEKGGRCFDETPKIIRVTQMFDFRESEGNTTEAGCYHSSLPGCKERGQMKLNVNNQCNGLEAVNVTYNVAGKKGLLVGSNKYIIGNVGFSGIIGKGLYVYNAHDVFIYGLQITDINPHVIWGGDAISLNNATNVFIDSNYIARIGRQMLVTGFGACQQITVSNNEFDGKTPYAPYCDGAHYWLWLFLGSNDTITLFNNYVHDTSGRGPHSTGMNNASVLLHMINNRFENISHAGLIESRDNTSRILVEGNSFKNVSRVISVNLGQMFFPKYENETDICYEYFGRSCYENTIVESNERFAQSVLNVSVLKEFGNYEVTDSFTINTQKIKLVITLLPHLLTHRSLFNFVSPINIPLL